MKWIDFLSQEDYGKEVHLNLFQYKRFCLFQLMLDIPEYSGSSGIIMSIGHSSVFGISLSLLRFGLTFDFCTWKARNLDTWRLNYFTFEENELGEITSEKTNS